MKTSQSAKDVSQPAANAMATVHCLSLEEISKLLASRLLDSSTLMLDLIMGYCPGS